MTTEQRVKIEDALMKIVDRVGKGQTTPVEVQVLPAIINAFLEIDKRFEAKNPD